MARSEENRENLLRDATAYVERAELAVSGLEEPVFVGFRQGGAASFFFGLSRVYHFNAAGELRRAYIEGLLYKAEAGRLCALRRERSAEETALVRVDLTAAEGCEVLSDLNRHLQNLSGFLQAEKFTIAGQVPADWQVAERLKEWLTAHGGEVSIATRPGVG